MKRGYKPRLCPHGNVGIAKCRECNNAKGRRYYQKHLKKKKNPCPHGIIHKKKCKECQKIYYKLAYRRHHPQKYLLKCPHGIINKRNCKACGEPCKHCKNKFPKTKNNRKYCSRKCFFLSRIKDKSHICNQCKNKFITKQSRPKAKFCSKKCLYENEKEPPKLYPHKEMSPEAKMKISKMHKGHSWGNHTEETKKIIGYWSSINGKGKRHSPRTEFQKGYDKKREPIKVSKLEIKIQEQLTKIGIPFIPTYNILGRPDLYLPYYNLCIFVDGCYWHGCPIHFKYNEKQKRAKHIKYTVMPRDILINKSLTELKYGVIRIWEHDIKKQNFNILNYLK
jgi:DNA mismatch endonuclease, patch repair protein